MFGRGGVSLTAVDHVSFSLKAGESLAIVGESGCGKTTLGMACAGLSTPTEGRILVEGVDIAGIGRRERHRMRRRLQVVFQDPMSSLNPKMRVGDIVAEPLVVHRIGSAASRRERVAYLLSRVGLAPDYAQRFPHELSGGQRQRVGIARALATEPRLIIADEPVSALDISIKAQIINLLADLRDEFNLSFLVVSHDFSIVEYLCDNVAVMYLGKIVEFGPTESVLRAPRHPYTQSLLDSIPDARDPERAFSLPDIGELPSPLNPPAGCGFHPRCPRALEICARVAPAPVAPLPGAMVRCHLFGAEGAAAPTFQEPA